ncbi:succinylglutamate-semialdehyde dehydrogenase [Phycisphaerales bacterium AB-hyl4]|uniref:Succinylglutamate-semialdehyde dehydrogenase n=1 Tax=Natronomicrosphaera hydrolytica TaxID=3242702 RepID=A0ABV4U0W5_9BACT
MHSHLIDNQWQVGSGQPFASLNPATGEIVWQGRAATNAEVATAIASARCAAPAWAARPLDERIVLLRNFGKQLETHREAIAEAISLEVGKPRWEATGEVGTMLAKVPTTIEAYHDRLREAEVDLGTARGVTRHKPHGVLGVFGPFNFPGHLPNGHLVPALLAGNTVVFKPSEHTPLTAQRMVELWLDAGLPEGVVNLVQGGRETGIALTEHTGHDGLLFTGSLGTGVALRYAMVDKPEKILALEMGGNNPLLVHEVNDLDAAAYMTIQSAYATAGQRCTCARRLIVVNDEAGDRFVERLTDMIGRVRIGAYTDDPEPFAGPVISSATADHLLNAQVALIDGGAQPIVEMRRLNGNSNAMLSPGLLDVTPMKQRDDNELFGPLLQLIRVPDFEAGIAEANRTAYGLVAGLLSNNTDRYDHFYQRVRAGLINFNRPTTGASGKLPFGGVGRSGNHRPSGYFAVDYCTYPVASLESDDLTMPDKLPPGIDAER